MSAITTDPGNPASISAQGQAVVLRVHDGDYAVPIGRVQEIIRVPAITRMPSMPPDVQGVFNLRGRVLPVLDLGSRLGLGPVERGRNARVVVVESEDRGIGLLVDDVSEVIRMEDTQVVPPSDVITNVHNAMVNGIARAGEHLIVLLDLDATLTV